MDHYKCYNCDKDVGDEVNLIYCDECAHGFCEDCMTFVEHQGYQEAFCKKCKVKMLDDWVEYNLDYEKTHYDIKLFNNEYFEMCWPNAGTFHTQSGKQIKGNKVEYIRKSKKHPMDIED